ncbi:hypothetical protein GCM10009425_13410 [Pseudomonas asuensis]|uniref:Uncharacterized protein n=1 Tax=Pseudomonas asuensis TaxID=1825787 RepID=A0ABQ2GN50_9PSED|nr:hypothetical protein GCM10009425_13410 [Pseudomonas asuensis]
MPEKASASPEHNLCNEFMANPCIALCGLLALQRKLGINQKIEKTKYLDHGRINPWLRERAVIELTKSDRRLS